MAKPKIVGSTPPTQPIAPSNVSHVQPYSQPRQPVPSGAMPGRKCPNCGIGVGDEAVACWQCKASLKREKRGDIDKRGWMLVVILSFVLFFAFFFPYASYSETEYDYYLDEQTVTTIPITGFELADGRIHRTIMGMSLSVPFGSEYPVLWTVPLMALACFLLVFAKGRRERPLLLGIFGLMAATTAIVGYAQLAIGGDTGLFSGGAFAPDYGLVATVIISVLLSLIGFRAYRLQRMELAKNP